MKIAQNELILDLKKLNDKIKSRKGRAETLAKDTFIIACSALAIANESGQLGALDNALKMFTKTEHNEAGLFRLWVGIMSTPGLELVKAENGGLAPVDPPKPMVRWDQKDGKFKKNPAKEYKKVPLPGSLNVDLALKTHWSTLAAAIRPEAAYDPVSTLRSTFGQIKRSLDKAEKAQDQKLVDLYNRMLSMIPTDHNDEGDLVFDREVATAQYKGVEGTNDQKVVQH